MKQNDFYEVDGCTDFIPVTINETFADSVGVIVDNYMQGYRLVVKEVYRFPKGHEPQKPVVPKFVADWLEWCKTNNATLLGGISPIDELGSAICNDKRAKSLAASKWAIRNQDTFARAWLDGYKVEQEKLYTVEIPNPNIDTHTILQKVEEGLILIMTANARWRGWAESKLTESEIKQDFEWAWDAGFAKEVEEK